MSQLDPEVNQAVFLQGRQTEETEGWAGLGKTTAREVLNYLQMTRELPVQKYRGLFLEQIICPH